jgi:thioredoxin-like negative regulator of GroEL
MSTRGLTPRTPFDQGLFLTHFNKGNEHYDQKRFDEAERELEEAYLLRPRDQQVLNLLGLVYFKQEKYEKAEEVYRKLIAESPEASTLHYNLGLIYLKLQRLEEAESVFLKALELARENPKINFYLGSIYEKQRRFPDAIYQYRQAGATTMVQRVEDKMAAATTRPPVPARSPRSDDTARFKTAEVRESVRRRAEEVLAAARGVHPPSASLIADGPASRHGQRHDQRHQPRASRRRLPVARRSAFPGCPRLSSAARGTRALGTRTRADRAAGGERRTPSASSKTT